MRLGLDGVALIGASFVRTREAARSLAADILESVIGAIYTDGGLQQARNFVLREILERASFSNAGPDARSRLQEYCQSEGMSLPEYRLVGREGPDHDPVFRVAVILRGREMGLGEGHTRKAAREEAARRALESIERMV
jgi:ribonuclease-3